jgi:heptosyltransferase-2
MKILIKLPTWLGDAVMASPAIENIVNFDAFFSFRGSTRSRFLKFLISAKNKYQFDKNTYQNRHQVEKYNDFVNDSLNTNFSAGKLAPSTINHQPSTNKTVGLNPGTSYGSAKRWYPQEFAKVASELSNQYDIVIFGGPGEVDIEKALVSKFRQLR